MHIYAIWFHLTKKPSFFRLVHLHHLEKKVRVFVQNRFEVCRTEKGNSMHPATPD